MPHPASPKWRKLIKKVWEADPRLFPKCQKAMRIVTLIAGPAVIERILRHLGLSAWATQADDATSDSDSDPKRIYANG